jgi:CRISPR/Cas system-associated exonuclease Cas4 (RecB family)
MDRWRDALHHGLMRRFKEINIILTGGVDDIWQDTRDGKLIVVDYKSQASNKPLDAHTYLTDAYHEGYKIQMDFYAFLLQEMGFEVSETAFFLVCNANRQAKGFFGELKFSETFIPYHWKTDWIPGKVTEMIDLMNEEDLPDPQPSCKNCAYATQREKLSSLR